MKIIEGVLMLLKVFIYLSWGLVALLCVFTLVALFAGQYAQALESLKGGVMLAASLVFLSAVSR